MTEQKKSNQIDWPVLLQRINGELAALNSAERLWLEERLVLIAEIQLSLDDLFRKSGGLESCAGCDGACCDCGLHHLTLTNLLAYLLQNEIPPPPDFTKVCPYLGERGCLLAVARRPYNCITFFCETLEAKLEAEERESLRTLDRQLRSVYQSISDRYPTASLRGLWIALERAGSGQLLRSTLKAC